jgi:hypothetical protein
LVKLFPVAGGLARMKTDATAYSRKGMLFEVEAMSLSEKPLLEQGDKPSHIHARRAFLATRRGLDPESGPDSHPPRPGL